MIVYYARPFSYNPEEARILYKEEVAEIKKVYDAFIVSTIPLSDYPSGKDIEKEVFDMAEVMIRQSDILIYKGSTDGVMKERAMAESSGVLTIPYFEIENYLKVKEKIIRERCPWRNPDTCRLCPCCEVE